MSHLLASGVVGDASLAEEGSTLAYPLSTSCQAQPSGAWPARAANGLSGSIKVCLKAQIILPGNSEPGIAPLTCLTPSLSSSVSPKPFLLNFTPKLSWVENAGGFLKFLTLVA